MSSLVRVLFLCTGNSCRSQMAEGFTRKLHDAFIEPFSAGTTAKGLDPRAVAVMDEVGIDMRSQRSKSLEKLRAPISGLLPEFDFVITVCGAAHESCPVFPGRTHVVHQGFDDPPVLALSATSENEALQHYRRVRDEIRAYVLQLPAALELPMPPDHLPSGRRS